MPGELQYMLSHHHRSNVEGILGVVGDIPEEEKATMNCDFHVLGCNIR